MARRVVVTGIGLVTPIAVGTEETWQGLLAGRSGIGPITHFDHTAFATHFAGEVKDFDPLRWMTAREAKTLDPFVRYAVAAGSLAVADSGLEISGEFAERVGCFGPGGNIRPTAESPANHLNVMSQPETIQFLVQTLTDQPTSLPAIDPLRRALSVQPSLIQSHFQLARAYRQLGRAEDAQHETKLFAAMNGRIDTSKELQGPEEERAWREVKPLLEKHEEQKALDYLAALPSPSNRGYAYYLLGAMYFSAGQRESARRMLAKAATLAPQEARVQAFLGMMQMSSGDLKAAEDSLQSALRLESDQPLALIGMGGLRYQQQHWTEAISYLEKSRTADPNTLLLLCDAYFRMGNKDEALLTAEVVRAFASDRPEVMNNLNDLIQRYERSPLHAK
jgi:tetratricopeptide (TPR) repeat protein